MSDTVYLSLISGGSALAGLIVGGIVALGGIRKCVSRDRPGGPKQSLNDFLCCRIIEREILQARYKDRMR